MPDSFVSANGVPENALAAVICNNVTYYGILGDTNGATPEVIGEASWLMAQTCFPDEDLDGAIGHGTPDVLCNHPPLPLAFHFRGANGGQDIVFLSQFFDVNETTITNYTALSQQGDQKMTQLIDWLISTNATGTTAKSAANSLTGKHNTTLVATLLLFASAVIFLM
jgi:chitosanase